MSLNTLNFCVSVFVVYIFFFFLGCPFFLLNNSVPFSHTWFFLIAFSQIWVPFGSGICLLTFLVCSPMVLHQFCSHQGGRKRNHMVFLQPFVTALMTSQLSAQVVTWWMGFSGGVGTFSAFLIFNGKRCVCSYAQEGVCYIYTMLMCTPKCNI